VYAAWGDSSTSDHLTLNVMGSSDGGQTWRSLLTVPNATNPALAVDDSGRVGFLFQQLGADSATQRWITRLLVAPAGGDFTSPREFVLANTVANPSVVRFQPFIGDYVELHASGTTFLGVFSATNHPNPEDFPNGYFFQREWSPVLGYRIVQRHAPLPMGQLVEVAPSIDPYFFSVGPAENAQCSQLRGPPVNDPRTAGMLPMTAASPALQRMAFLGCKR
jgi:hypothetical protein